MELLCVGVLVCWCVGVLVCWCVGVLVCVCVCGWRGGVALQGLGRYHLQDTQGTHRPVCTYPLNKVAIVGGPQNTQIPSSLLWGLPKRNP